MRRIGILGTAISMMASMAGLGSDIVTAERVRPVTLFTGDRSRYMPHQGAKERERAKRCYMHATFCTWETFHVPHRPRSTPVMQQMSKREYELRLDAELTARAG